MHELIALDPRNAERLYPYLGGEELNSCPTYAPARYIIDFGGCTEQEARRWPQLFRIVEERVKPQRFGPQSTVNPQKWWLFARPATDLYAAVSGMRRVVARSLTSTNFSTFSFVPTGIVFDQTLVVFALSQDAAFALLTSRVHECWAVFLGGTMKDDPRYNVKDCFRTFPLPPAWEGSEALEQTGRTCFEFRSQVMIRNNEGPTKLYNRLRDPDERDADILKLRDLHAAMDRAVLDAYGWTDIQPHCEFILDYVDEEDDNPGKPSKKKKPYRYRWPDDIRDEVLGRLLELNAQRAKEEALAGATAGATERTTSKKHKSKKNTDTPLLD
jgi:hypothetical protein